tara:strand:+ start:265 stop:2376 length:2112 start_codon:yes stop_codon:yes gene_type:complete
MATEAEIKKRIEALTEEAELQQQIFQNDNRRTTALQKSQKKMEEIFKLENQISETNKDISKTISGLVSKETKLKVSGKDRLGLQRNVVNETKEQLKDTQGLFAKNKLNESQAKKLNDISESLTSGGSDLTGIKLAQLELDKMIAEEQDDIVKSNLEGYRATLGAEERRLKINEALQSTLSATDSILGGIGSSIAGFLTNPLTIATAVLLTFNETQQAIGDEFGALGVTQFRDDLAGASQEFTKIGLEAKDALTSTKSLSSEFGIGFQKALSLSDSIGDIAVSTGMSAEESGKLIGALTTIGGLTEQGAVELAKSAESLAVANDVAPAVILKDIAANTETFAKFSSAGTEGLTRAAIQARKLGVEFSSIAGAAEGMLDFQSSLNAEVEASVLLGRNVNLQKARELALSGDLEGFQSEILKQVGSQAEFDKMNVLQKNALAKATGLTVTELGKMVSKEKEAVTLQGELAKQDLSKIVPEETITATAELIGNFKAIGLSLAETLGPTLEFVVGTFGGLLKFVDDFIGIGPALLGLFVAIKTNAMIAAAAQIYNAVAGFFGAAALGSTATLGFGTLVMVGMATAAVAALMASLSSVGDLSYKAGDRPIVSLPNQPNALIGRKDDDVLMAPGIAGGGGNVTNDALMAPGIAVGGGNGEQAKLGMRIDKTNEKLDKLIANMESYFGLGGSAIRGIGNRVGENVNANMVT